MATRISVVVPTYNRRGRLEMCLRSLAAQTAPVEAFEVIVVVDGSTDGTLEWLGAYEPPYALRWLHQANRGLSAARNRGNSEAACELILCIDDDMVAAPVLIAEHLRSHDERPGCLVQGSLRIHESVCRTPFIRYEERRLGEFDRRLREGAAKDLCSEDVSGGNTSMLRSLFAEVGGFKESLKDLSDTDGELAYRLERRGVPIIYNSDALASLTFVKDLDARLCEAVLYGRTYVDTQRDFPETIWRYSPFVHDHTSRLRNTSRRYLAARAAKRSFPSWPGRALSAAIRLGETVRLRSVTEALYRLAIDYHFWSGVDEESGGRVDGYVPRGVPVLCYHNVSDVRNPAFRSYILPVKKFVRQIERLRNWGYRAVSLDALYEYLDRGTPLPRKAVVITFDDGYGELGTTATPALAQRGYAHTHFINAGKIGGRTDWVERAPDLPLLGGDTIREMAREFGEQVDFQAHGQTHRSLSKLDERSVRAEVKSCIDTLQRLVGRPVRYMAYPYGEYDAATPGIMASLSLRCSFTVDQGLCRPGQPMHLLPRIEIFRGDSAFDFYCKVRFGRSPISRLAKLPLRRILKRELRALLGRRRGEG